MIYYDLKLIDQTDVPEVHQALEDRREQVLGGLQGPIVTALLLLLPRLE